MISGAIERQRQRNENRKNDALIANTTNDILPQTQLTMPMAQNWNGWENTFHSSGSPMAQFDTRTVGLMPTGIRKRRQPAKNGKRKCLLESYGR